MKINLLDPKVYNRIAAGEVVEKPASVVKEMVENSIDAGASKIRVEIYGGGIEKIVISDNGTGIEKDDLRAAFLPHATSKIKKIEDLDSIETLGFRGEALSSIASVSHVTLSTKTASSDSGFIIQVSGGEIKDIKEISRNNGTTFEVCNLFYNTPVRAKFLRKPKTEEQEVTHIIQKFMLSHPEIAFNYFIDGKEVYNTTSTELSNIIYTIYGKEVYDGLIKVDYKEGDISLKGYLVSPKYSRPNRTYQNLFISGRYIENYQISGCIQSIYEPYLMKGRFPIYVLNLIVPPSSVDVNVHPSKREVKFENIGKIFGFFTRAIKDALEKSDLVTSVNFGHFDDNENDLNRIKQSFNYIPASQVEPISSSEGSSYKVYNPSVKDAPLVEEGEKPFETQEIKESEIFKGIKIDTPVNTNRIFFDQALEKTAAELNKINEEKLFKESLKSEIKVLGSVFNTYVFFELRDNLYIVDQHAAHERQLYDKLVLRMDNSAKFKQSLLSPYHFTVNNKEREMVEKLRNHLFSLGFEIYSDQTGFNITCVPLVLNKINLKSFVDSILSENFSAEKNSDICRDKLAQTACKHAVKGGDSLSVEALADLVENMKNGKLLCPHGRPILVKVTKKDLEKLFKRIV